MSEELGVDFASQMRYELKRAERYRIFLSLLVFNLGPMVDMAGPISKDEEARNKFVMEMKKVIRAATREIDFVSNSGRLKVGILLPETSRQGAEAATRRISNLISQFCSDYLAHSDEYPVPVEIVSFPDASGARSISSYVDEFKAAV
jgi:hypothetical protein